MTWPPRATSCALGSASRPRVTVGGTSPKFYAELQSSAGPPPAEGFLLDPVSDESKKGWRRCTPSQGARLLQRIGREVEGEDIRALFRQPDPVAALSVSQRQRFLAGSEAVSLALQDRVRSRSEMIARRCKSRLPTFQLRHLLRHSPDTTR